MANMLAVPGAGGGLFVTIISVIDDLHQPSPSTLELQTKVRRDFIITKMAPTRAISWVNVSTSAFTFKTVLKHYAKWAPKHSK